MALTILTPTQLVTLHKAITQNCQMDSDFTPNPLALAMVLTQDKWLGATMLTSQQTENFCWGAPGGLMEGYVPAWIITMYPNTHKFLDMYF